MELRKITSGIFLRTKNSFYVQQGGANADKLSQKNWNQERVPDSATRGKIQDFRPFSIYKLQIRMRRVKKKKRKKKRKR